MQDDPSATVKDLTTGDPRIAKALVMQNLFFNKEAWMTMEVMCKAFQGSGALPSHINNPQKAMVIVQMGLEMGLSPMQAINSLYLVNGRVGVEGKVYLQKMYDAGVKIDWVKRDANGVEAKFTYKERPTYTAKFGPEDAERAGLSKKDNYIKWPVNMYIWKVVEDAGRFYVPELLFGAEVRESWDMDIIEAETVPQVTETPENSALGKLKTQAEKKEEKQQKKVKDSIPEGAINMQNPQVAEIVAELEVAENIEDIKGCHQMIVNKSWQKEEAQFLGEKYVEHLERVEGKSVPLVDHVGEAFATEEPAPPAEVAPIPGELSSEKPSYDLRSAGLRGMKSVDLKPIMEKYEIDYTGLMKEDRIMAILKYEYPEEFGINQLPGMPQATEQPKNAHESTPVSEAPVPQEPSPFLSKLFNAGKTN